LYLGGLAAFTIGDYENAANYFSKLLRDYPDYKREHYISENYDPDPDYSEPVKPGLTKLLFYCQIVNAPTAANGAAGSDAFAAFQQFNTTSIKVLSTQVDFAKWLLNRPHKYQRRIFLNEDYGDSQPEQYRASMLPRMDKLVEKGWADLFPAALKKSGSLKMRAYLRELTNPDSLLKETAAPRLVEVDQLVIKSYFYQAKVLLNKQNFDAARKMYRRIIAEYPDSAASRRAEEELPRVVSAATKFYKVEGDKNFHPDKQFGVPQTKALEYFEKMYNEDPENASAEYALYYWARALGTEGKVKKEVELLQLHLSKFPKSKLRAKTLYLLAFTYGNNPLAQHDKAIVIYQDIVSSYPRTEEASEALWQIAFLEGVNSRFDKAIAACRMLVAQYPKSYRYKVAKEWEGRYGEWLRSGKKWPG